MEKERTQTITAKSIGGFVRAVSGLLITPNSTGLSPKELTILCRLVDTAGTSPITKEVKTEVANATNHSVQVIANYVSRLKKRGAVTKDNKVHPLFFKTKITIEYEQAADL